MARFDPAPVLREISRLRDALLAADYTVDPVSARLGPVAAAALARAETTPAQRELAGDGSPLATLIRLWPLQGEVARAEASLALPGLLDVLAEAGIVQVSGEVVRARVDIRPYGDEDHDWWIVCDLLHSMDGRVDPVPADHVPGVGGASTSLAQLTVRAPVARALDLGTGCGVQALHLATHADAVVGTDINGRALGMARIAIALAGLAGRIEVREGDFVDPVAGQRFDLIVANPPFVVSPDSFSQRLAYRDAGMPGDSLGPRLLATLPGLLAPGGTAQLLANWEHRAGQDWQQRVADWVAPLRDAGADVWVLQREVLDPAAYAETWLRDAGHHRRPDYRDRYRTWLDDFASRGVTGIGFGWVSTRLGGAAPGRLLVEEHAAPVAQPLGPAVAAWFARTRWLAGPGSSDAGLMGARLVGAAGLDEERYAEPGASDPRAILLRQHTGLLRAGSVDTATAGLVGACDGELAVGVIIDALARLLDRPEAQVRDELLPRVRRLVEDGYLAPAP